MLFSTLYLLIAFQASFVLSCPINPLPPCTCKMIGYHASWINCMKVENEINLIKSLRSMKDTTLPIKAVEIVEASLQFLPHDAFYGLEFPKLAITDSQLVALTDTDVAFEGLEDILETLIVQECLLHSGWSWHHLNKLKALTELHTMHAGLEAIDDDVKEIAHLNITNLFFTRDKISYIHDTAFATFRNLITLSLKQNEIEILRRSMFPDPAPKLKQLILSHNKLKYLPKDLFYNMPNLQSIILSDNEMFTLYEAVFKPVWHQLVKIDVSDNPLKCDCRMKWFLKLRFPKNTRGKCDKPTTLRGIEIKKLMEKELWC